MFEVQGFKILCFMLLQCMFFSSVAIKQKLIQLNVG